LLAILRPFAAPLLTARRLLTNRTPRLQTRARRREPANPARIPTGVAGQTPPSMSCSPALASRGRPNTPGNSPSCRLKWPRPGSTISPIAPPSSQPDGLSDQPAAAGRTAAGQSVSVHRRTGAAQQGAQKAFLCPLGDPDVNQDAAAQKPGIWLPLRNPGTYSGVKAS
jgi:hypothetical protein